MQNINASDFSFFTFITGLENKEQILVKKLFSSFPYKNTHKINLIDKSKALKKLIDNKKKINYSERHFILKNKSDFQFNEWNKFLEENRNTIEVFTEKKFDSHMESIQKILADYSKSKYVVILDSDVQFINNNYLSDIINYISKDKTPNDIAAVGQIYQEAPFSLPLKPIFSNKLYKLFLRESLFKFSTFFYELLRSCLRLQNNLKHDRMHKLPRLFCGLLALNRELYLRKKMESKYLWIDVDDYYSTDYKNHRVVGDAGSSLLFQIGMSAKKIININHRKYVKHQKKGSRSNSNNDIVKNWFRFDEI